MIDRLTADFAATLGPGQVAEVVDAVERRFADSTIRDFIPVLIERLARAELLARQQLTHARQISVSPVEQETTLG